MTSSRQQKPFALYLGNIWIIQFSNSLWLQKMNFSTILWYSGTQGHCFSYQSFKTFQLGSNELWLYGGQHIIATSTSLIKLIIIHPSCENDWRSIKIKIKIWQQWVILMKKDYEWTWWGDLIKIGTPSNILGAKNKNLEHH